MTAQTAAHRPIPAPTQHTAEVPDLENLAPVIDPDTGRILYADPATLRLITDQPAPAPEPAAPEPAPAPAQPAVPAVDTRISGRAKGAALLTATGGASLTGVTLAVGQVAPQLGTAGHAIEAAGIGVAAAAAGVVLVKAAFGIGGKGKGKTVIHHTETHNHTTTASGWFARAKTTTHRR